MDTACIGSSVLSLEEYKRYCRETGSAFDIYGDSAWIRFGDACKETQGRKTSLGKATVRGLLPESDTVFEVEVHVIDGIDAPMLISLNDLNRLGFDVRTVSRTLHYNGIEHKLTITSRGFLVLRWEYESVCMYTLDELKRFHRAFGHRGTDSIMRTLQDAGYEDLPPGTREQLEDIARRCDPCQRKATRPHHFSISSAYENSVFNYTVAADVCHFSDGAVLHMKCLGSKLIAAGFVEDMTAAGLWRLMRLICFNVYVGPMHVLRVDQGSNLVSAELRSSCLSSGVEFQSVPTESPWRIGAVERGHRDLEMAYESLKSDVPKLTKEEWLSMAAHTVNCAVHPDGVSPSLVAFGKQPRPVPKLSTKAVETTGERMDSLRKAQRVVEKRLAKAAVAAAKIAKPTFSVRTILLPVPKSSHGENQVTITSGGVLLLLLRSMVLMRRYCLRTAIASL